VALLRGINVGGRNKVAMRDLRAAFQAEGYDSVATYIQSGNVLFAAEATGTELESGIELEPRIEAMLHRRLGLQLVVVVRAREQMRQVVAKAPEGFGSAPDTYHSDVIFLKAPLTSDQAMQVVTLREGVDQAWPGSGVLYFQRLTARRTQSRLSTILGKPEYQQMTIRSWSTTTKVLGLLEDQAPVSSR
jgi:uncharacterized protein (DUF1697 family)